MFSVIREFRSVLLIIGVLFSVFYSPAQGRFVSRVEKTEFSLTSTAADFYVSPSGNNTWTGKLAEPNKSKTDFEDFKMEVERK